MLQQNKTPTKTFTLLQHLFYFITFCVSRRRRKVYCGHARLLCLSVCLSAAIRPHRCTDPDVTCGVVEAAP